MTDIQEKCVAAYRKHKHLGMAGDDVGIPWQTVYWHLKNAGETVMGDRRKHGSQKDKFAGRSEIFFKELVPAAEDQNDKVYQSKCDFILNGALIEIKASSLRREGWCFSLKKQSSIADFFVCFGYAEDKEDVEVCFILPRELVDGMQTLRVGRCKSGKASGKWSTYQVRLDKVEEFFSHIKIAA